MTTDSTPSAVVHSVSQLTGKIKQLLEFNFPFIWIYGEVSNKSVPLSGHCYFTLKDDKAQISAVMFRNQYSHLKFKLENGMSVTCLGRLSVFEPRGSYQLILEHIEPRGIGALQAAFEQLKKKMGDEGLYDPSRKKPLPFLPSHIAVISSPTGAVVHDILRIIDRRFPNVRVTIVPAKVQGEGAEQQIVAALDLVNQWGSGDIIILARGGGSLEDLQAFNAESVARAIARSRLPVISAVGHETDYTIADFVADLRAPTPSAAAELAVPVKSELLRRCDQFQVALIHAVNRQQRNASENTAQLSQRLKSPQQVIDDARLKADDLLDRLVGACRLRIGQQREHAQRRMDQLFRSPLILNRQYIKEKVDNLCSKILYYIDVLVKNKKGELQRITGQLDVLDPRSVLDRGYSITRSVPDGRILKDPALVRPGQFLDITLAKGSLQAQVPQEPIKSFDI